MKIVADRKQFTSAFRLAADVAPSRCPRETFKHVLVRAKKDGVECVAWNGEVGIRAAVTHADVKEEGEALIIADRGLAFLSSLEEDKVVVAGGHGIEESQIFTEDGPKGRFRAAGIPEDFPKLDEKPEWKTSAKASRIATAIERVKFALASPEDGRRFQIDGCCFDFKAAGLQLAATDRKRLAIASVADCVGFEGLAVISRVGISALAELGDGDEEIKLAFTPRQIIAKGSRGTLFLQRLAGTYPPYESNLPAAGEAVERITFDAISAARLIAALKRAALFPVKDTRACRIVFSERGLEVSSLDGDLGSGKSFVSVPVKPSANTVTFFDPDFLAQVIGVCRDKFDLEVYPTKDIGLRANGYLHFLLQINIEEKS